MIDFIFQGDIDARFTDWDSAREFVIFQTIVPNPRLTADEKVALQKIEQDAYDNHANQTWQTEKTEIARYYTYLRNQFPSATSDQRFLAIFESAAEVKADQSSVGLEDVKIPPKVQGGLILAVVGVGLFFLLTSE
jgi:hypothetical protein